MKTSDDMHFPVYGRRIGNMPVAIPTGKRCLDCLHCKGPSTEKYCEYIKRNGEPIKIKPYSPTCRWFTQRTIKNESNNN